MGASARLDARPRAISIALLVGFAAAVALRVGLGGHDVSRSAPAGLAFAACLLGLTFLSGTEWRFAPGPLAVGLAAGAALCIPSLGIRLLAAGSHRPAGSFVTWAGVVAVVAIAEEGFLRGALWDSLMDWLGPSRTVWVTSACFALLHLPLYGLRALPLDLGVGIILGGLRAATRSPTAPAAAHVTADLLAWWLR